MWLRAFNLLSAVLANSAILSDPSLVFASQLSETVSFSAPVFSDFRSFLRGASDHSVTIEGELSLPQAAADEKLPVVVVLHTCSGAGLPSDVTIKRRMQSEGYATLVFDSLKPRGWSGRGCTGEVSQLDLHQAADSLLALKAIASHPRIDNTRIAVAGASMGGRASIWQHGPISIDLLLATAVQNMRHILVFSHRHEPAFLALN